MFTFLLTSGIATGLVYALTAVGIVTLIKATDGVNFAHGDITTLGAFIAFTSVVKTSFGFSGALLLALCVAALVGYAFFALCRRLFQPAHAASLVIATIGLAFVVRGVSRVLWGGQGDYLSVPSAVEAPPVVLGENIIIPAQQLLTAGGAALVLVLFALFFRYTRTGLFIRAVADNPRAAVLVGIRHNRMLGMAFVLSLAVALITGVLMAPNTLIYPDLGFSVFVKGFAAAILGGIYSFPGAVLGGLLVGLIETMVAGYVSSALQELSAFIIIMFVLVFIPGGLLSRKEKRGV